MRDRLQHKHVALDRQGWRARSKLKWCCCYDISHDPRTIGLGGMGRCARQSSSSVRSLFGSYVDNAWRRYIQPSWFERVLGLRVG